ncbi:hypothetical protein AMBLS11_12400 [Alteromonas macleodii str. 'Black Sea 11']|nr:hypothetical protein AMBLS11_12400 [Alteromonas macleodii str. 'Black Sea 11']
MQQTTPLLKFNTGRHYGEEGQIIEAYVAHQETCEIFDMPIYEIHFDDITRHITGKIRGALEFTQEEILRLYDKGGYESLPTSIYQRYRPE